MYAGHLTVTYAARGAMQKNIPVLRPLVPLLAGALLPDTVDKPFYWWFDAPGRGIAHAAIPLAVAFYILFRLLPRHRGILAAVGAGVIFHLIEDWPHPYVIAWPLMGTWEYFPLGDFDDHLLSFYRGETHPYLLAVEIASWPFCIYYWLKSRLPSVAAAEDIPQP